SVLKGAGTLVAAAGETIAVCGQGNPGMAAPGMGDLLTGIIAALIAQGLALPAAARAGVMVHALAGDHAARDGERGLTARDVIKALRRMVNP
ncbi:MAG: bifunctional ADP-dependent NAD(P)H-hydrate dehydratase/NAD(P)H-hydrate epimerase, partial [Gammaproteobacteria bacterium]|nr:bifunctional ADP-dependent NAD(P)H-hydrate dehydratase/NAD(P)H-hydrate epimerase [Gammaproteobacteria bacterium]